MKVFVAGAGAMGAGIAQVFSQGGWDVVLYDISLNMAQKGLNSIEKGFSRLVEKGRMDAETQRAALAGIKTSEALQDAVECDLVIEAIIEDMQIKQDFFAALDKICKPKAIFATNTSSLSITEISSATSRQDKFVGMHFFNPAPIMKLVEVIKSFKTSDETFNFIYDTAKSLGKEPIEVQEAPGFVVNKILVPMINEAICVLEQGVASAEDIDKAMCLGTGHPLGPLALSDLIGNDVVLNIMNILMSETGDPKYRPAALLKKMVRANLLGKKTGAGFYDY